MCHGIMVCVNKWWRPLYMSLNRYRYMSCAWECRDSRKGNQDCKIVFSSFFLDSAYRAILLKPLMLFLLF